MAAWSSAATPTWDTLKTARASFMDRSLRGGNSSTAKPPSKGQSNSTGELSAQIAAFTEQVRQCVDQSGQVITGNARNVDLTIAKMLHPGVIIRTGRCRVVIDKTMRGPIRIRGNQSE